MADIPCWSKTFAAPGPPPSGSPPVNPRSRPKRGLGGLADGPASTFGRADAMVVFWSGVFRPFLWAARSVGPLDRAARLLLDMEHAGLRRRIALHRLR